MAVERFERKNFLYFSPITCGTRYGIVFVKARIGTTATIS